MSATTLYPLPLDKSGMASTNLISGEEVTTPNRQIRAIVTQYGAYYGRSMIIMDLSTGLPLTANQWYPAQMYTQPTLEFGKGPVYSIIMITDPSVSNNLSLTYQAVGGGYCISQQALVDYINNLGLDTRNVAWPAIIDKPNGFDPDPHLHTAGDIYGFEYLVQSLDRIVFAIETGNASYNDAILAYVDAQNLGLTGLLDSLQSQLTAHISDQTNPHKTTAAQVGAYTIAQTNTAIANTAASLSTSISTVNSSLVAHTTNTDNPHQTTAAQVGAYTAAQTDAAISSSVAVVSGNVAQLSTSLSNHTGNINNPHQTTAGQVGAYTTSQTDAAISTSLAPVSSNVASLSTSLVGHTSNTSNPHATTASQVGAYTTNQTDALLTSLSTSVNTALATKAPASANYAYQLQTPTFADIHANGTIYSNGDIWAFASDIRTKYGLELIEGACELLEDIHGYYYRYLPEFAAILGVDPDTLYVGLSAQEVQAKFPSAVGRAPFDTDPITGDSITGKDYLTVKYDRLVPVLLQAIKSLNRRVKQLERPTHYLDKD